MRRFFSEEQKLKRRLIAIVFEAALVIVVLLAFASMSFGWFSKNVSVNAAGMTVSVKDSEAVAEYCAYIYDVKDARVKYTGDPELTTATEPRIDNLDMQFHDTIFAQRNRYTPAVIRIRLTKIQSDWLEGGTINLTLTRDTTLPEYETNPQSGRLLLNEYFTSIMRFTLAQNKNWYNASADTLYDNIDTALYTTTAAQTANTTSSTVFTTVTKSGNTVTAIDKVDSITIKTTYTASDIVDGHLDIYLYLTYDKTLVGDFQHASGIDSSSTTVGKITEMVNDMTGIVVSFERNS